MKRIDPYFHQKKILKAFQLLSAFILILFILSLLFNWQWPFPSLIGALIGVGAMYFVQRSE